MGIKMKRASQKYFILLIVFIVCSSFLFVGCKRKNNNSEFSQNSQNLFSTVQKAISTASKNTKIIKESGLLKEKIYPETIFWGEWELESNKDNQNKKCPTDKIIKININNIQMPCLPDSLVFLEGNEEKKEEYNLPSKSNYCFSNYFFKATDNATTCYITLYRTQKDSLLIGFVIPESDKHNIWQVEEKEYKILSWVGWKLVLDYEGESAVYVPQNIIDNSDLAWYGELAADYKPIDNIIGISLSKASLQDQGQEGVFIRFQDESKEESEEAAEIQFSEDGIVEIKTISGKEFCYEFRYSGDTLTLISGNQIAVYKRLFKD